MLRHCATEVICATLCGPKKVCSNHCDSKWVCCDIVRHCVLRPLRLKPKLFARLCVAQKKFVATIATQNGYVATLCDRSYLHDFVWPKKSLRPLRPLRLKMGMLRHCATEVICATLCGPKKVCPTLCEKFVWPKKTIATQLFARLCGYVATLCDRSYYVARLCVFCSDHCDSKWVCCDIVRPKLFARLCVAQKNFCSNHCDSKWVCCDIVRPKLFARLCVAQKKFVLTIATGYVATLCDRSYLRDFV